MPKETEDDHGPKTVEDNAVGRLFALSDGVFAIAMTLLALDLRVPDLSSHPTDA
ncbi:MAG: TMEM175 family protein, partial [Frankia sp.]